MYILDCVYDHVISEYGHSSSVPMFVDVFAITFIIIENYLFNNYNTQLGNKIDKSNPNK